MANENPNKLLQALDKSIEVAGELARQRVEALRQKHPDLSDAQLLRKANTAFTSAVTTTGAATGALAAAPGVGTAAGLVAAAGDTSWFLAAAAAYVLCAAELRGIEVENFEHQRALVLMVLAGGGGSTFFTKAASRTGPHLGKIVTNAVPLSTIRSINKVLGAHFITKYGTKRGIIAIGKVAPFGVGFAIGAGGNLVMARGVINTAQVMFDSAEALNSADERNS
ncbi:hypothetical protein [Mycobacterium sp. 29Ha]|uniref:hypothetical protein n=1 Tax=Mycobacterium sp. 29Ha TaxID=2939268 RepID=UPI00293914FD|nr:hypothetical protein [Mycobacterium sp. 29Ha]MDV3135637.1 hypothetical protein [Mycobacterium sp. 29Ha]